MQGKVELSGVNTSKLPLLKNSEMRELIAAAQSGDTAAREKLISGNLRLVLSVIQKFSGYHRHAIGGKLHVLVQVKAVDRLYKSYAADLKQIVHALAASDKLLNDR